MYDFLKKIYIKIDKTNDHDYNNLLNEKNINCNNLSYEGEDTNVDTDFSKCSSSSDSLSDSLSDSSSDSSSDTEFDDDL